jgi:hypothetical protein
MSVAYVQSLAQLTDQGAIVDAKVNMDELVEWHFQIIQYVCKIVNEVSNMSVFDQINKISVSCRPRVKVPQETYIFRFI